MTQNYLPAPDEDGLFVPLPRAKQRVIDTIKNLGLRVLPGDVVARTGLPIHEATTLLNKVASETLAVMQVSSTGELYYVFSPGFERTYAVRGLERTVRAFFLTLFRVGFFLVRISFGVMLIVSLLVVVILIVVCLVAALFSDSGGDVGDFGGGGGGGSGGGFFDLGSIGDGFSWNYTDSHQRKIEHYGVADRSWRPKQQIKKGNFFLECFSFLFGDGDPNTSLEEIKWQMITEVIRANNYVVTAEQLAPYTGRDPKDDAGMFETLARFDGQPVVTETGSILYVFDSLRRRAVASSTAKPPKLPRFLEENTFQFSEYPAPALITAFLFASANFIGSWWLFKHIATIDLLQHFVLLIDILLAYGALFLLIPALRLISNACMNALIEQRNRQRETYAQALTTKEARTKLAEAQAYAATQIPALDPGRIIYKTDVDYLEQQFGTKD